MTRRTTLLLTIPLIIITGLAAALLALPGFVSSSTHRATIEAAASALTGRTVRIAGALHLTLLPSPEITAQNITITGPNNAATITAAALTLDLSGPALLHGKLSATSISLDHPNITFPWPLPGGPAAIAAPGWLTALHAQMIGATITLGSLTFTDANADIFTGTDGTVSISGTARFDNQPVNAAIALAPAGLDGVAPLSLHATQSGATADFSGTLDATSTATGTLKLAAGPLHGTATLTADATSVNARNIALFAGRTTITGTAGYDFAGGPITGSIATNNLSASLIPLTNIPFDISLDATDTQIGALTIPEIQAETTLQSGSLTLTNLTATFPGDSSVTGTLTLTPSLSGTLTASTANLPALAAAYHAPAPPWLAATLTARNFSGTPGNLSLPSLSGTLGQAHFTGRLHIAAGTAYGALNVSDSLDLLPLLTAATKASFPTDGELTAAHATIGPIPLTNVLIDGAISPAGANIRRFSANLYRGLAAVNFVRQPDGSLTTAHGFLLLPAATKLADFLPFPLPAPLAAQRLAINAAAAGPPSAVTIAATATLGDFTLTASPTINIPAQTAAGALTLRHPNAIRAASFWDLNRGLAWPGAGSLSIRANMALALSDDKKFALPDFILSAGTMSATGTMTLAGSTLNGIIDATTLALPPLSPRTALPPLPGITAGKLTINAGTIFYKNQLAVTSAAATLSFAPPTLTLQQAKAAGGTLTGTLTATTPSALSAAIHLTNADAAQLSFPGPYIPATGTLTASAALSATGYSFRTWADTLSGTASLTATNGTLPGVTLPATSRAAATTGSTQFTTYTLATSINAGTATLTTAAATTPFGPITANGLIDLPDATLSLHLTLPRATVTALGPWSAPKLYARLTHQPAGAGAPPHPTAPAP